jgi:hypothetical protein
VAFVQLVAEPPERPPPIQCPTQDAAGGTVAGALAKSTMSWYHT